MTKVPKLVALICQFIIGEHYLYLFIYLFFLNILLCVNFCACYVHIKWLLTTLLIAFALSLIALINEKET